MHQVTCAILRTIVDTGGLEVVGDGMITYSDSLDTVLSACSMRKINGLALLYSIFQKVTGLIACNHVETRDEDLWEAGVQEVPAGHAGPSP